MKFGLWTVNMGTWASPSHASRLLRAAEESGFDSIWTGDHIVVPRGYRSDYPVDGGGPMPFPDDHPFADSLCFLSWAAAQTTRLLLCTGVLVLPARNAVEVAKEIATLDTLSGGRVVLGVGIGWMREEFDALGVPFSRRGARLDDAIGALRALWSSTSAEYAGPFYALDRVCCSPQPAQPGGPPVVISGNSDVAARRAGRIGDGWFPMDLSCDALARGVSEMRTAASDAGRDPGEVHITHGVFPSDPFSGEFAAAIDRYAQLGVDRVILPPPTNNADEIEKELHRFAKTMMVDF